MTGRKGTPPTAPPQGAAPGDAPQSSVPHRLVVVLSIGRLGPSARCVALPAEPCRAVLRPEPVFPMPGVPPSIVGVFQHRGRIEAVADLARLLDAGPPTLGPEARWILCEADGLRLVLAVSQVRDVAEYPLIPSPEEAQMAVRVGNLEVPVVPISQLIELAFAPAEVHA